MDYINSDNLLKLAEAVVSIVGLTVAWLVFKLQAFTFESQLEVTKLAQKKFLFDIRPEFSMTKLENTGSQIINTSVYTGYTLKLNGNVAIDFYIVNFGTIKSKFDNRKEPYIKAFKEFDLINEQLELPVLMGDYRAELWFRDEVGTQYKQIIKGDIQDLGISPPIQVK